MAVALAWCVGAPWQPAPAAAAAAAVDLTAFELEVLPAWLQGFQVCDSKGKPVEGAFRQKIGGPPAPYGTADVIHLLSTVNQLNFSEAKRDSWAAVMAPYQNLSIICNSPNSCERGFNFLFRDTHTPGTRARALHVILMASAERFTRPLAHLCHSPTTTTTTTARGHTHHQGDRSPTGLAVPAMPQREGV